MPKLLLLDRVRVAYVNACVWIATRLLRFAKGIFNYAFAKAMSWDKNMAGKLPEPTKAPTIPAPLFLEGAGHDVPTTAPVVAEKPSARHKRLRAERLAAKAEKASAAPQEPTPPSTPPTKAPLVAPDVNPFTDSNGQVPMCMDPMPSFVVFEAMFEKKYGRGGRCPINMMGQARAYTCKELFDIMSKIESEGANAGPAYNALYGTVMSLIVQQHGRKIEAKDLN